jgi:hypothetical protein
MHGKGSDRTVHLTPLRIVNAPSYDADGHPHLPGDGSVRRDRAGRLGERESGAAVDANTDSVPDARGGKRGDREEASVIELELEPDSVFQRHRAGHVST